MMVLVLNESIQMAGNIIAIDDINMNVHHP